MPRRWDPAELRADRGTKPASGRLSRTAARLLAATATATAVTALVASSTHGALVDPVARAAAGLSGAPSADASREPASTGSAPAGDPGPGASPAPGEAPPADGPSPGSAPSPSDGDVGTGSSPVGPGAGEPTSGAPAPGEPAPDDPAAGTPDTEYVSLTDDAGGRPLFLGGPLAPGARSERCLVLTYTGPAGVAPVLLRVEASGPLTAWLTTSVEVGSPAGRDCAGFVPTRTVATGTLRELADAPTHPMWQARSGESFGARIVTVLSPAAPDSVAGTRASAGFAWHVET